VKIRSLLLIAVSLVLGIFAVALVNNRGTSAVPESVTVVAAKVPLNFGDHLSAEKLRVMSFPPDTKLEGAFARIEDLTSPGDDRVVLRQMVADEIVLSSKVSGSGGKATLSTVVEKGMRAMTIRVNDVTGGGGFVLPQDRVDVLLTRKDPTQAETVILLQNIRVLGVDQQADEAKDKPIVAKAVTLEVSPDDAQKLTLGSSIGSLSLALRNFANPDAVPAHAALSANDLFKPEGPAPKGAAVRPAAAPPRRTIEIIRGTDSTSYDIDKDTPVKAASNEAPRLKSTTPPKRVDGSQAD